MNWYLLYLWSTGFVGGISLAGLVYMFHTRRVSPEKRALLSTLRPDEQIMFVRCCEENHMIVSAGFRTSPTEALAISCLVQDPNAKLLAAATGCLSRLREVIDRGASPLRSFRPGWHPDEGERWKEGAGE